MRDPIYYFADDINIDDITAEIIETPEFKRLYGIKQAGITGLLSRRSYTRGEHSMGVYYLLRYLGASIEQCIGGLLHDIYHTNFSHTTDDIFCGDTQESFHEKNKFKFFKRCCKGIKQILLQSFPDRDYLFFLDGPNMLITKNKSFGADMIDYFIRDGFYEGALSLEWVTSVVSKLKIDNTGHIILNDKQLAREFFEKTIYINDTYYMSPASRGQYHIFAKALILAMQKKVVTRRTIVYGYKSDEEIYARLKRTRHQDIRDLLYKLETGGVYTFNCTEPEEWEKMSDSVHRKLRFLDPSFEPSSSRITTYDKTLEGIIDEKKKQYERPTKLYAKKPK